MFFPHEEGYVDILQTSEGRWYNYVYNYIDHLGNIRVSYAYDQKRNTLKIIEENHYYPYGLKHKNYNSANRVFVRDESTVRIDPTLNPPIKFKYKYNGMEWQDELGLNWYDYHARNYDPAIGRWMNIDPLAETSRRWSPFTYCYNNPVRYVDPDGMQAIDNDDIIKVNNEGYIQSVEPAAGPHVVVNEAGEQLPLNDPASNLDQEQLSNMISAFNYTRGTQDVRLFTPFSNKEMASKFNEVGIGSIKETAQNLASISDLTGPAPLMFYTALQGHGAFDFADDMSLVSNNGGNAGQGTGAFPADGTGGFIKFENSNTLYNVYDAGNFMTGKALNLLGVPTSLILTGGDINSRMTRNGPDTAADQNALYNGANYSGVKWRR